MTAKCVVKNVGQLGAAVQLEISVDTAGSETPPGVIRPTSGDVETVDTVVPHQETREAMPEFRGWSLVAAADKVPEAKCRVLEAK